MALPELVRTFKNLELIETSVFGVSRNENAYNVSLGLQKPLSSVFETEDSWRMQFDSLAYNGKVYSSEYSAVVSLLFEKVYVPTTHLSKLATAFEAQGRVCLHSLHQLKCVCSSSDDFEQIELLKGNEAIYLNPQLYLTQENNECFVNTIENSQVWHLGSSLLNYYSLSFDLENKQIGFN